MALVTYEQAMAQLRLSPSMTEYEDEVVMKMDQATAIVVDYLHDYIEAEDPEWTEDTDPADDVAFALVQAAILDVLANLWRNRGDDGATEGPLTGRAVSILRGLKVPALG